VSVTGGMSEDGSMGSEDESSKLDDNDRRIHSRNSRIMLCRNWKVQEMLG